MSKKKMPKIEIFKDESDQFRFRVKARNGEIVAQSESYTTSEKCIKGINALAEAMWQYECLNIDITKIVKN